MNNSFNNTEVNNNENSYTMIKIVVLLIGLQLSRIILKQGAFIFLPYNEFNEMIISMGIIFLLTIFIILKSKKESISLNIFSYMKSKESKVYYLIVTSAMVILILTSSYFPQQLSVESILPILYSTIMIPIYEEITFRTYIWRVLEKENMDELKIYFLTTILFSLYHIGYIDTIIMTSGFNHMALLILIKCSLMLSYGVFIGFFRYKIKNSYSCILVHSFINVLGR